MHCVHLSRHIHINSKTKYTKNSGLQNSNFSDVQTFTSSSFRSSRRTGCLRNCKRENNVTKHSKIQTSRNFIAKSKNKQRIDTDSSSPEARNIFDNVIPLLIQRLPFPIVLLLYFQNFITYLIINLQCPYKKKVKDHICP